MSTTKTSKTLSEDGSRALVALLAKQCDLYGRLDRLADRQRTLITGDAPEDLLAVLGERQCVIDQLSKLAECLRPFQEDWPGVRAALEPEVGRTVDGLVADIHARLSKILAKDEADAQLLAARKSATSRAMASLRAGRQAGAVYATVVDERVSQMDWTDE